MTDIRAITAEEVPLLLPGARAFYAEHGLYGKLNAAHFMHSVSAYIHSGAGVVFTASFRGAIGAIFHADWATGEPTCMEHFWYVHPEERGSLGLRLLKALEEECVRRGTRRLFMMHLASEGAEPLATLYKRRGYRLREQVFVREF